jgi:ABC-type multidrug transport system ATPase subunit/CRP-like cAMP-binding protein
MTPSTIIRDAPENGFRQIEPRLRAILVDLGVSRDFYRGQPIIREGAPAEAVFFCLSGQVDLKHNNRKVARTGPRLPHFGLNDFEPDYPYSALAVDQTNRILTIDRPIWLERLSRLNPKDRLRLSLFTVPLGAYLFIKHLHLQDFDFSQDTFLPCFRHHFFSPGQTIIHEGEEGDTFFIIAHGHARVTRKDRQGNVNEMMVLNPGDYFGEIALLEGGRRLAGVQAIDDLSVFSLSRMDFESVLTSTRGRFVRDMFYQRINTYTQGLERAVIGRATGCQIRINDERIAPEHAVLTKTETRDGRVRYSVTPMAAAAGYMVYLNKQPIKSEKIIGGNDELYLGDYKAILDSERGELSFQKANYYLLSSENMRYAIGDRTIIDGISFTAESSELVAVMGPSGCGKSTLLELLYGNHTPNRGAVFYNRDLLHHHLDFFRRIFGFVPQDDILFPELTVFENLLFSARLRDPSTKRAALAGRIDVVLERLRLFEQKHSLVGSIDNKGLSGGQRKRVNIARELLFDPHILFLDEPTSGLSSKDSQEIISFLRDIADMGKMVIVVLHQPGSEIFTIFDRIIFLDQGGKLVFTGSPLESLTYMKEAVNEPTPTVCSACGSCRPEQLFDILEKTDEAGQRIHQPDFWKQRFEKTRVENHAQEITFKARLPEKHRGTFKENMRQLGLLLERTGLIKIRNRGYLMVTLGVPLVIAALLGIILRYRPDEATAYTYYSNKLAMAYLFVGVIFSIFLGLTNSAREIVDEQAIFKLESNVGVKVRWYVLSKFLIISVIIAAQILIFVLVGNTLLEIGGMHAYYFLFFYLIALLGAALGLLLSSLYKSSESVVNWIPLILIPQIILGGALIEYQDMGRGVYINTDSLIPEICQVIPSRWAHEALVVAQATVNPRDAALNHNRDQTRRIRTQMKNQTNTTPSLKNELDALKKAKAEIDDRYPNERFRNETLENAVLNGNGHYVSIKAGLAEGSAILDSDRIRIYPAAPRTTMVIDGAMPFYGDRKGLRIGSFYFEIDTLIFNAVVLVGMTIFCLFLCMLRLHYRKNEQRQV